MCVYFQRLARLTVIKCTIQAGKKILKKKSCNYSSRYTLKPNATATCEHQVSNSLLAPLIIGKEEAVCWWGGGGCRGSGCHCLVAIALNTHKLHLRLTIRRKRSASRWRGRRETWPSKTIIPTRIFSSASSRRDFGEGTGELPVQLPPP